MSHNMQLSIMMVLVYYYGDPLEIRIKANVQYAWFCIGLELHCLTQAADTCGNSICVSKNNSQKKIFFQPTYPNYFSPVTGTTAYLLFGRIVNLFYSIYLLHKQIVCILNSAAHAVTKTRITPTLKSLHWLKIDERIKYKVLSQTYNPINRQYQDTVPGFCCVTHFFKMISDAPLVKTRNPSPSSNWITVLIDFLTELNV